MLAHLSFTFSLLELSISFSDELFRQGQRSRSSYCATDWTHRCSNLGRGSPSDFETCRGRPWGPTSRHFNAYGVSFPGVKWSERDIDHLLQSSVEVESVWRYTSIPFPTPSCTGRLYFLSQNLSMQQTIFDVLLQLFSSSLPDLARINEPDARM